MATKNDQSKEQQHPHLVSGLSDENRTKVVAALNKARAMELYSITQYMLQHYILDDTDYGKLAANMKLIAIDEMRHAELFAERIKDLEGEVATERDNVKQLVRKQEVSEIFPFDTDVEDEVIETYNQLAKVCRENGDNVSARLLEDIIQEEQVHRTYFDNESTHIKALGQFYLSKIAGTSSSTGGTTKSFVNKPVDD